MLFLIIKTSDYYGNNKPHEDAKLIKDKWYIKIRSLKHLMTFIDELNIEKKVVITSKFDNDKADKTNPTIEIYDDYRE